MRARDRDSERTAARSDARSTSTNIYDSAAPTGVIRSSVQSKLLSRVRGVEQPIRALSGARNRDRVSAPLGREIDTLYTNEYLHSSVA